MTGFFLFQKDVSSVFGTIKHDKPSVFQARTIKSCFSEPELLLEVPPGGRALWSPFLLQIRILFLTQKPRKKFCLGRKKDAWRKKPTSLDRRGPVIIIISVPENHWGRDSLLPHSICLSLLYLTEFQFIWDGSVPATRLQVPASLAAKCGPRTRLHVRWQSRLIQGNRLILEVNFFVFSLSSFWCLVCRCNSWSSSSHPGLWGYPEDGPCMLESKDTNLGLW